MAMLWSLILLWAPDVVQNGLTPENPVKMEMELRFTLGANDEDNEIFSSATTIAADDNGNIYVLDPPIHQVVVFDAEGKFKFKFGKAGQGPGELQSPSSVWVHPDGNLIVFDTVSKKMNFYDQTGKFVRELALDQGIQSVTGPSFAKDGRLVFFSVKTDAQFQMTYDISLYGTGLEVLKPLISIALPPKDWNKATSPEFWVEFLKEQFEQIALVYPLGLIVGDRLVTARSDQYHLDVRDLNGEPLFSFAKKSRPKPLTEEGKRQIFQPIWEAMITSPFLANTLTRPVFEEALSKSKVPDYMKPIVQIFNLADGIGVFANMNPVTGEGDLDYFDLKGRCLASIKHKFGSPTIIGRGDSVFAVGNSDADEITIQKYKIKIGK